MNLKRGVAICHYNRLNTLEKVIDSVLNTSPSDCRVVVCDDGSDPLIIEDKTLTVESICKAAGITYIQGPNIGVAANKNRALWALQDCDFLCILEDDLMPISPGWFEKYEEAACLSGIHHFCRVQNKEVPETIPAFSLFMSERGLTPIYGPSPRGDLTFLTGKVIGSVGAFNPEFKGAGYAHGEWTERVVKAKLIPHPLKYVDIKEARDMFEQIGDTVGGRWEKSPEVLQAELLRNKQVLKKLQKSGYIYHPLVLT